jgi:hypothetical protein
MDDVAETIGMARDLAGEVIDIAGDLLSAGLDIGHVQERYAVGAIELLSEAEAQAVLAASDDEDAVAALVRITGALADLRDEARANSTNQDDDDCVCANACSSKRCAMSSATLRC